LIVSAGYRKFRPKRNRNVEIPVELASADDRRNQHAIGAKVAVDRVELLEDAFKSDLERPIGTGAGPVHRPDVSLVLRHRCRG
jgi:hypothetical protein